MHRFFDVQNDFRSYLYLIDFYYKLSSLKEDTIDIDCTSVSWINASSCSIIGAIVLLLQDEGKEIRLQNINARTESILHRNGFMSVFGAPYFGTSSSTPIPFRQFHVSSEDDFTQYVAEELFDRYEMPSMSKNLRIYFIESMAEIFENAAIHSETTKNIITCGQYFPNKNIIEFMITDLGIGMKNRINKDLGTCPSGKDAIHWVMSGNTTKQGEIPGGLGLQILKTFIQKNGGYIQILSNEGFWQLSKNNVIINKSFNNEFPGTVLNFCINTDDKARYCLSSEKPKKNVF